jgi:hypothetical protein
MERHHQTLRLWEPAVVSSQTIRRADLIYKAKMDSRTHVCKSWNCCERRDKPVSGADIIFKCLQRRTRHALVESIIMGRVGCGPP